MSKKNGGGILSFITGVVAGAAVGILVAPDNGRSTRDRLSYRLDKYQDMLQDVMGDLMSKRNLSGSHAKSESQRVISDAIAQAERLKEEVDALRNQISH